MYKIHALPLVNASLRTDSAQVIQNDLQNIVCSFLLNGESAQMLAQGWVTALSHCAPHSALELHQLIETMIHEAENQGVQARLAVSALIENRCILLAHNASIFLKRGEKIGKVFLAEQEIKVVEGSIHPEDIFVLSTYGEENTDTTISSSLSSFTVEKTKEGELLPPHVTLPAEGAVAYCFFVNEEATKQITEKTSPFIPVVNAVQSAFRVIGSGVKNAGRFLVSGTKGTAQYFSSFTSHDVYVRRRSLKHFARIVIPVIIIIAIGIGFFVVQRSQRIEQLKAAEQFTLPAQQRVQEIKGFVQENPIEARKQTEEVIAQLEAGAQQLATQKIAQNEVNRELAEVRDFYQTISGQEQRDKLPDFYDLTHVQQGFIASDFHLNGGIMIFLDEGQKKMIALNVESKQQTSLPIGEYPFIKDFIFEGRRLWLLANGIYQYSLGSDQPAKQLKAEDDQNRDAEFIRVFGSYVYVLNKTKGNIYRYVPAEGDTLTDAVTWLRAGQSIDFQNVHSFTIDGDVWLTTKQGRIQKFTSGQEADFEVKGLKESFTTPITLYTREDLDNLYVVEPQKNRMVVLTKEGDFLKEVQSSSFASVTSIVADETLKKAFALSGSLVFEVGL